MSMPAADDMSPEDVAAYVEAMGRRTEPAGPALERCVETFRRWLYMPDPGGLYVALATVAANLAPGDPVWTLLVGPPSAGKTETIAPLERLPYVYPAATITEAALLSGTAKRDRDVTAKGGLLREIGEFGILLLKDFTSVLAQNRDARAQVLAALREIYDGSWTRHVGTDGGRTLHWRGKLGLVAGVTPAVDIHHAVMSSMGERMVLHRLPDVDAGQVIADALGRVGNETVMREELAAAVHAVLDSANLGQKSAALTAAEKLRIGDLAVFGVRCRSAVQRDGYSREVELLPTPEGPARLGLTFARLLGGMRTIGVPEPVRWELLAKLAGDCMPAGRRVLLEWLAGIAEPAPTGVIATETMMPTNTARRHLEDLTLLAVVERVRRTRENEADRWALTPWTRRYWPESRVPEIPDDT
jgi:hypothetical protein